VARVVTGEGNTTTYEDKTFPTNAYRSTITDPTGAQTVFQRSADSLSASKSLPCGSMLDFNYASDAQYGFKYLSHQGHQVRTYLQKQQ
jgi:hypothetical protein